MVPDLFTISLAYYRTFTYHLLLRANIPTFLQVVVNKLTLHIVQDTFSIPSCNTTITLACLRALYNMSNYVPVSTNVNKLAIAGYDSQFANYYADLHVGNLYNTGIKHYHCQVYLSW